MFVAMALMATLLGGAVQDPAGPVAEAVHATESEGHGEDIDILHHILDGREIETPLGVIHLPAESSWMVAGVDMTPTRHVVFLWIAAVVVLLLLIPAAQGAKRRQAGESPRGGHNAMEAATLFFRDQVVIPNIGHGGDRYVPFVLTLFFFILIANLLGLLPWGATPTANISVTAGLAILSFIVIEISGMRALGAKGYLGTIVYIPHGMNWFMKIVLMVIMTPVELLGKLTKPFALAIRLMANMVAGHVVLLAIFSLIFVFGNLWIAAAPVLMAVVLTFLEIFVAFLQAYVFALLTSVFIGLIRHAH